MAVAGFKTRTFITTAAGNPTSADVLTTNASTDMNESAAELETNYQGSEYTSLITGKFSTEVSLAIDWDPASSNHAIYQRLYTAFRNRTVAYVTVSFDGSTTGQQVGVMVTAWQRSSAQDGKVTVTPTLRSCTMVTDVTTPVIALS
jgi:hypothetical protein